MSHDPNCPRLEVEILLLKRKDLAGAEALLRAWGALVAMPLVALFMQVLTKRFIVPEEARLRQIFGAEFNAYKNRTRRWI